MGNTQFRFCAKFGSHHCWTDDYFGEGYSLASPMSTLLWLYCGGTVLRWLADYLTGRTQQVVINNARSSSKPCSRGVPQGSVLGPLLFSLYVHQVPRVFKYSVPLQYADDISIWITGSNTSAIVTKLQSDLHSLDSHLDDIDLKLNPTKTKFMVIRKPNTYDDFANSVLTCKGEQIEVVQQAKYLGIFIDEH